MPANNEEYPATFNVDYTEERDSFTVFFRLFWSIPILIILSLLNAAASGNESFMREAGKHLSVQGGGGIAFGLFAATLLMIVFRQRYPRWWFNFALELSRFSARVGSYLFLLTDRYPSTVDKQSVRLDIAYPNVRQDLNRWLPLVKWFLAIPHYVVLFVLVIAAVFVTIYAWFAILFTGQYPKDLFDFVVGVGRWGVRVQAYAFLLATDKYPPFSLS